MINDTIGNKEFEDLNKKFIENFKLILKKFNDFEKRKKYIDEEIKKACFTEEEHIMCKKYFEEKNEFEKFLEKISTSLSYVYPNFIEFLEEHKGYYVSFEELYKQIDGKQNILDEIKAFVKYENENNKNINFIIKGKMCIDNNNDDSEKISQIKELDKNRIIIYYNTDKLNIYSSKDLSLMVSINIKIISPIIVLKNKNILFASEENENNIINRYIMILNSETFKKEEKILLFLNEPIYSLIQLTNGDIALAYKTAVIIYTTKNNNKYNFKKLIYINQSHLIQTNNDSLIIIAIDNIFKFSIKDYTLINILPNLGYNEKILKLNSDIYVLFGGEIGGAVSESLTLFLDLNKFEVIYYEYINRIFEEINPLFKDNYYIYYKWHVWTNSYEHKEERLICKLIQYENSYRFINSPDYYIYSEGFFSYIIDNKYIKNLVRLSNDNIIYLDERENEICLIELEK